MHKQRQGQTGHAKRKGKKLKNLTPLEAHQRALKSWQTKHSRYKYGRKVSRAEEENAGQRWFRRQAENDKEPPVFEHESDGGEAPLRRRIRSFDAEPFSVHADTSAGGMRSGKSFREELRKQAEEYELTGKLHEDFDLKGLNREQLTEFQAQVAKVRRSQRLADARRGIQETASSRSEEVSPKDPMAIESDKTPERINKLTGAISRNPKVAGQQEELMDVTRLESVITTPGGKKRREDIIAEKLSGSRSDEEEVLDVVSRSRPVTKEEVRKRAWEAVNASFNYVDPDTGNRAGLITQAQAEAWVNLAERSFFASSEAERSHAAEYARRHAVRLSQHAQRRLDERTEIAATGEIDRLAAREHANPSIGGSRGRARLRSAQEERIRLHKDYIDTFEAERKIRSKKKQTLEDARTLLDIDKKRKIAKQELDTQHAALKQEEQKVAENILRSHDRIRRRTPRLLDQEGQIIGPRVETLQDLYDFYGHEKGNRPFLAKVKAQYKFNKDQLDDKFHHVRKGTFEGHWAKKGAVKPEDAFISIAPRNKEGARDTLITGETVFRSGKMKRDSAAPLLPWESEEVIVPVHGLQRASSKHERDPEVTEIKQVRDITGRWFDASDQEFELAKLSAKHDTTNQQAYRTVRIKKFKRITYVNPKEARLAYKQKHDISTNIANRTLTAHVEKAPLLLAWQAGQRQRQSQRAGELAQGQKDLTLFRSDPDLRASVIKINEERIRQGKIDPSMHVGTADERAESHIKEVGIAGILASYYGTQERVRKGYIPNRANKAYESLLKKHPHFRKKMEGLSMDDARFAVNEAYIRPGIERFTNVGYQLRHPFSSLEYGSKGWSGADIRSIKWRKRAISPELKTAREIELADLKLDRVLRTKGFIERNAYRGLTPESSLSDKIKGSIARYRSEPLMRHPDYANLHTPEGLIAEAKRVARQGLNEHETGSPAHNQAAQLWAKLKQMDAEEHIRSGVGKALVKYERRATRLERWSEGNFSTHEKAFAGGVGALAALGAGTYAYHRYQEHKKPEAERTKFINKALPPAFGIRVPTATVAGRVRVPSNFVTNEFLIANKKVPVAWNFHTKSKTVALRPVDRGYTKNASLGITGIRFGEKVPRGTDKGKFTDAVFFNPDSVYNRKKSFRPSGKQVVLFGKELPVKADIGRQQRVKLKATNPNRLSQEDRENIVWAFHNHSMREDVKNFYSFGKRDKIVDMFDDQELLKRLRKRHGAKEAHGIQLGSYIKDSNEEGKSPFDPVALVSEEDLFKPVGNMHNVVEEYTTPSGVKIRRDPRNIRGRGDYTTGGTGGMDPYSQIGQPTMEGRKIKYEEHFNPESGQWELHARPVGSRRVRPEDIPAEKPPIPPDMKQTKSKKKPGPTRYRGRL